MKTVNRVLLRDLRPQIPRLFLVFVLMMATTVFEAISPLPFKYLIDNVLGDDPIPFVNFFHNKMTFGFFVVFIFFFVMLMSHIVQYMYSLSVKKVTTAIIYQFSQTAFESLQKLNIGFYRTQEIGDYIYRLGNDVLALGTLIEEGILPIFTSLLFVLAMTSILFFINVDLTILSLMAMPFLVFGLYFFNKRIVSTTQRSERWNSAVFSFIQEALSQLRIIQAFSREKTELTEFKQKMRLSLENDLKLEKLNLLLGLFIGAVIAVSYSLIIGYGLSLVMNNELSTGLLIIFIFYLDDLTNPILSIIYAVSTFKENAVKVERMNDFFEAKSQTKNTGVLTEVTDTTIDFEHVNLLSKEGLPILRDISVKFPAGKLSVIVGVSGSGKSSIVSLIPRLIDEPSCGKMLLGEHQLQEYDIQTIRQNISLVPQDSNLFNDTIYNIITFGRPDSTEEDVRHAARLACADAFIERLPRGYHFRVGDGGNYLSGGQRQRLMLARAFLKDAQIYIFDEPMSALDLRTRQQIWESIGKVTKGKTTIIVSNVLDVISEADLVVVVDKGKIVDTGKHMDLRKKSNFYNLILHEY